MTDTTSTPIAKTVASLPGSAAERFASNIAARHRDGDEWQEVTYAEAGKAIEELALGLVDLGIEPGDRVCILANTRLEWTLASYAISAAGAVIVPVYPTNSPHECKWVAGNSGARAIIVEDESQRQKIDQIRDELPDLEHVIGMEQGAGDMTLDELRERGAGGDRSELTGRQDKVDRDDAWIIIYTSGTTGPPKGVVLTHANAMQVCHIVEELEFVKPDETTYLYLPLAHIFALLTQLASYDQGTTIVYFGGDSKQILAEVIETKPTYLPSVPRIFEKLYAAATKMQENASDEDKQRFRQAIKLGVEVRKRRERGEPVPEEMQAQFEQADEQIFAKVRQLFGGQVRQAVSGAAPIAPEILEFFYAAGVPVMEGWGMTETTGVGTVGTLDDFKFGTVGKPLPGVEIRIAEEDNEILMRGPERFQGVLEEPRGDRGHADRRLAPHRRCGRARRRGVPEDHRPQEGHHHHRRRQEPHPREHRERPQAVPVHLAGGDVRGPQALSGRADHARPGGDPAVGQGARPPGGPRRAGRANSRSRRWSRRSSTGPTPTTPRSSRSRSSRSSITTWRSTRAS